MTQWLGAQSKDLGGAYLTYAVRGFLASKGLTGRVRYVFTRGIRYLPQEILPRALAGKKPRTAWVG